MKLRNSFATLNVLLGLLLVAVGSANAQHLISSKAGFVNRADGAVYVLRHDSEDGKAGRASLGTQLRDGDRLSTDANSRAEVLLNPGSYLRLDENSEVRAVTTTFSETRFELLKGSAIVEVGQIDKKAPIEIVTPNGCISIAKDVLVRIDAKTAATWVAVRQGEIYLGTREVALADQGNAKIKRGKVARLTGGNGQPELAKVDKDTVDNFDSWSFNRAQTLVAANLSSVRQNSLLSGGWFYNAMFGCYTFVPNRGSLFSPYGFGFFRNAADCYWYDPFYGYGYYPYYYPRNSGNTNNGGGQIAGGVPARVISGVDRAPIRREMPGRGLDDSAGGFGRADMGSRGISSAPSSIAAPVSSAPATISAPAPERSGGGATTMPTRGNN